MEASINWDFQMKIDYTVLLKIISWWRHKMETFFALLVLNKGNPHRWIHLTKSSDPGLWYFFYLRLNNRLSKPSRRGDLKRHRIHYNVTVMYMVCATLWFVSVGYWLTSIIPSADPCWHLNNPAIAQWVILWLPSASEASTTNMGNRISRSTYSWL